MKSRSYLAAVLLIVCAACDKAPPREGKVSAPSPAVSTPARQPLTQLIPITNMIAVRAGAFLRKGKVVSVPHDYWLGKYEVTQREFSALLGRNPSHFEGNPDFPVEKVSFHEASSYCAALTERERSGGRLPERYEYRLPSEAEWELACRAGSSNRFSFGDSPMEAEAFAWTAENSGGTTHPAGLKEPNAWGFHDMHGNVWEWCLDWFTPSPEMALNLRGAPGRFKIFKGGGWNQEAEFAGAANKFMMEPERGIHFVGFRVALGPVAAENPHPKMVN